MTIKRLIAKARNRTGLGYRLLARAMEEEGYAVHFRLLFRWSQGRGPSARTEAAIRDALERIIDG